MERIMDELSSKRVLGYNDVVGTLLPNITIIIQPSPPKLSVVMGMGVWCRGCRKGNERMLTSTA